MLENISRITISFRAVRPQTMRTARVDLTRRRIWFDDKGTDPGGQDKQEDAPGAQTTEVNEVEQLPDWARKELTDLRSEAKKRRLQLREQEAAASKAEESRLAEQAKWQELAEKRGKELDALKGIQEKVDRLETAFLATLSKRIDALPDQYKGIVPDFDDPVKKSEWLDANAHLFQQRSAPNQDAGAGNSPKPTGSPVVKLTDTERELAKIAGISEADFVKFRDMKGQALVLPQTNTGDKQ